jgi:O-methyltransferase involved in polyketide biosynthesis
MLLAIYGRAEASRAFPDILRDDEAIRIIDSMDYDFTQIDKSYGAEYASLCCPLRAKRFDERCLAYISRHPDGAAVNPGSGLDTTFSRVDDGSVRWYNIDLPNSMTFRRQFVQTPERCADIAKSMFDYTCRMVRKTGNKGSEMHFYVNDAQKLKDWSPKIRKVESVPFFEGL